MFIEDIKYLTTQNLSREIFFKNFKEAVKEVRDLKYDEMDRFKAYLNKQVENNRFSKSTANTYYSSLNKALENIYFNNARELNLKTDFIYEYANDSKRQNKASKFKNALKIFGECTDYDYEEHKEILTDIVSSKINRRLTKSEEIQVSKMNRKIASLKKSDLKAYMGFKIMQLSGVRVGTMSLLRKTDFIFDDDKVCINLRKEIMKGDKSGVVELLRDEKFRRDLQEYLEDELANEKLFYRKETYIKKAIEKGFECHDLRRICAKIVFRRELRKGKSIKEAKSAVKRQLCHTKNTYKKYLSARANFRNVNLNKYYVRGDTG